MSAEFDRRLNEWFEVVEPRELPARILPNALGEARRIGQQRRPWHRLAANLEQTWSANSSLSPALVLAIVAGLLILTMAAVGVASGLIQLPSPPRTIDGLIAVEDAQDEVLGPDELPHYQIRFIDPQTGEDVFTTPNSVRSCAAHFSPDGSHYAFLYQETNQGGVESLYVAVAPATADSQPTLLVRNPLQSYFDPSWAPDGSAFVMTYEREVADPATELRHRELLIVPADGSPNRTITDIPTSYAADWSPSGDWIAFVAEGASGGGGHEIYAIRPDGTDLQMLRPSGGDSVAWSPLRDELAYTASDGQLHVIALDRHQLFNRAVGLDPATADQYPAGDLIPLWSPDATKIALTPDGLLQVFDIAANTVTQVRTPTLVTSAAWSADGRSLVVVTAAVGKYPGELWQVFLDDSEPRQIAQHVQARCMSDSKALSWQVAQ